jgi:hypothetical protein
VRINVNIDNTRLLSRMRNAEKRMAFAVVNAINSTALKIQEAEKARVLEDFTVRKKEFVLRQAAIIKPFASVGKAIPYAEIAVGQKDRLLLSQFEIGGERKPFKGKRVAVPIIGHAARPVFSQPVPKALQFTQLHFTLTRPKGVEPAEPGKRRRRTKKSKGEAVRFGAQDTYLIPGIGVFQRKGHAASQLLYAFVAGEALPKKLAFVDVASATARRWFPKFLDEQIASTLARHAGES